MADLRIGAARRRPLLGAAAAAAALLTLALAAGGVSTSSSAVRTSARFAGYTPRQRAAITAKVNALLSQMTVAEKFGQFEMAGPTPDSNATLMQWARKGQIGSVLDLTGVSDIDQVQRAALQSRLHIPLIFSLDVIHGYRTMFPVPPAEASSWDLPSIQRDEQVSAAEATADGIKWTFNPMVDVSRDPRWGRVVEGAGEDPYLGAAVAAAKVRGYQGADYSVPDRMAATIKHFAGYGAPVAGREYNTVDMSLQQLFNDYLPSYQGGVDAGVATVMSAFNSLNGVPRARTTSC